jgi:uncharacterized protein with PQ loop repeat
MTIGTEYSVNSSRDAIGLTSGDTVVLETTVVKEKLNAGLPGFHKFFNKWMYMVALFGNIFLWIQGGTMLANESSRNVSFGGFLVTLAASSSWLIYGILTHDNRVKLSSSISLVGVLFVLMMIIMWAPDEHLNLEDEHESTHGDDEGSLVPIFAWTRDDVDFVNANIGKVVP